MDGIDIAARLIGAFYVVGGLMGLHAAARDALLDKALAALTSTPPHPDEALRRRILATGAVLTGLSGGALVLLAGVASWLFLSNLAFQAGWLIFAARRFPPMDAEETVGRRRVANAAVVWAAATAAVLWLDFAGRLGSPADPRPLALLALGGGGMVAWLLRHLLWKPNTPPAFDFTEDDEPRPPPARVRLVLRYGYGTLWDAEDGRTLNPYDHLPHELAARLLTWEDDFHIAVDPYAPEAGPRFAPADAEAHAVEGEAIAVELRAIFGDDNVEGPTVELDEPAGEPSGV